MLSDDITDAANKTVNTVVNTVRTAVKGALIIGAIAGAFALGGAIMAAGGVGAAFAGEGVVESVITAGALFLNGAKDAALLGGAAMGVASLVPGLGGSGEGYSLGDLFKRKEKAPVVERSVTQEVSSPAPRVESPSADAPSYPQPRPVMVDNSRTIIHTPPADAASPSLATTASQPMQETFQQQDNPYFREGKGMEMLQRGNANSADMAMGKA